MEGKKKAKTLLTEFKKRETRNQKVKEKLKISNEMSKVKELYWWAKFENREMSIDDAAVQCKISPSMVSIWFDDEDIKQWFMAPPIKFGEAFKIAKYFALKKINDIMETGEQRNQLKAACYLIDQATGKAKEKSAIDDDDEDDDFGIDKDMELLDKLENKDE